MAKRKKSDALGWLAKRWLQPKEKPKGLGWKGKLGCAVLWLILLAPFLLVVSRCSDSMK